MQIPGAQGLLRIGEKQTVIDALETSLSRTDYNSRVFCYTMACELGAEAKPFASQLKSRWEKETVLSIRVRSAEALIVADADAGKDALAWLREQLRDPAPLHRAAAAAVLARVDPQHKQLLPVLIEVIKTLAPAARGPAIEALGRLGPAARPAVPLLKSLLEERIGFVNIRVAEALWRIDSKANDVLPALLAELPKPSKQGTAQSGGSFQPTSSIEAARTLGRIGPPAKAALPALRLATYANDDQLSLAALHAIREIEGK